MSTVTRLLTACLLTEKTCHICEVGADGKAFGSAYYVYVRPTDEGTAQGRHRRFREQRNHG